MTYCQLLTTTMSLFFHFLISLQPSTLLIIPFFFLVCKPVFGISDSVLSGSYFSVRFRSVSVNIILSTPAPLSYGVPRGCVLGPIVFVLYTYPVFTVVNAHSLSQHSFSGDNQLYVTGTGSELSSLVLYTQPCISELKFPLFVCVCVCVCVCV